PRASSTPSRAGRLDGRSSGGGGNLLFFAARKAPAERRGLDRQPRRHGHRHLGGRGASPGPLGRRRAPVVGNHPHPSWRSTMSPRKLQLFILTAAVTALLTVRASARADGDVLDRRVDVALADSAPDQAFQGIAKMTGLEATVDPGVSGKVTV